MESLEVHVNEYPHRSLPDRGFAPREMLVNIRTETAKVCQDLPSNDVRRFRRPGKPDLLSL
jgi:hypothetical protein